MLQHRLTTHYDDSPPAEASQARWRLRCRVRVSFLILLAALTAGLSGCGTQRSASSPPAEPTSLPTTTPVSEPLRRVVVVFSYEPDFWATVHEQSGIVSGLAHMGYTEGKNLQLIRFYMNTKTLNKTQEQMAVLAEQIVQQIKQINPDAVILLDDDALRHVGARLHGTSLPVTFGGINGSPEDPQYSSVGALVDSLERPGHNMTGVLERISLTAGFELIRRIAPQARTALFITDDSSVMNVMMKQQGGEAELKRVALNVVEVIYTDDFERVKATILDYQEKVDVIVLFFPFTFVDQTGRAVPQQEAVAWLLRNSRLPEIAFFDVLAEEGYLCGVVVDLEQQGHHAALIAARILNGESPAALPVVDPIANRVTINLARASQLGITIPFSVLQSADAVFDTMNAYPEYKTPTR